MHQRYGSPRSWHRHSAVRPCDPWRSPESCKPCTRAVTVPSEAPRPSTRAEQLPRPVEELASGTIYASITSILSTSGWAQGAATRRGAVSLAQAIEIAVGDAEGDGARRL